MTVKVVVSQGRWSLVTGSVVLTCGGTFCQESVILQDRWSLTAVVTPDSLHCSSSWDIESLDIESIHHLNWCQTVTMRHGENRIYKFVRIDEIVSDQKTRLTVVENLF